MNTGYFGGREIGEGLHARRESISWAANQLHISGSESDDGTLKSTLENVDGMPITPGRDGQRGVIRRAVTRRGNMLVRTYLFFFTKAILKIQYSPKQKASRVFEQHLLRKAPQSKRKFVVRQKLSD